MATYLGEVLRCLSDRHNILLMCDSFPSLRASSLFALRQWRLPEWPLSCRIPPPACPLPHPLSLLAVDLNLDNIMRWSCFPSQGNGDYRCGVRYPSTEATTTLSIAMM
ncbi:hypothetical protein NL676_014344 [Syzygium grande]|nr:hypothetical protein NL676_014344 [Syzygium grande]